MWFVVCLIGVFCCGVVDLFVSVLVVGGNCLLACCLWITRCLLIYCVSLRDCLLD